MSRAPKATGLAIHWQMFGSNGEEKVDYSRGVLERFTRRAPKDFVHENKPEYNFAPDNRYVKIIANPRKINLIRDPHDMNYFPSAGYTVDENLKVARGMPTPIAADKIVLNHYFCKSWEEYSTKRGRGDVVNLDGNRYDKTKFLVANRNDEFDDGILKYRDARTKVYQLPDRSHIDERLLKALRENLLTTLQLNIPQDFYVNKTETFLTCLAVATYFKKKFTNDALGKSLEILSLEAILKSLDDMNLADAQLLIRELPNILSLPYSVVKELRGEIIQRIPKIMDDMILFRGNNWRYRELIALDYLMNILKE